VLRRALTPKGTLVLVGAQGGPVLGGMERVARTLLLNLFVGHRLRSIISIERQADLAELAGHLEAGTLTPVIDRTFALVEAPGAIRHVAGGQARGKVVIQVSEQR
jgi:NADPH:quinone reductase-like Zn-dependent oxidoreductase